MKSLKSKVNQKYCGPWSVVNRLLFHLLASQRAYSQLSSGYSSNRPVYNIGTAINPLTLTVACGMPGINGQALTKATNWLAGYMNGNANGVGTIGLNRAVAMKIVKPNAPGFKSKVGFTLFISALCFTLMVQAQTQTNNYVLTQAPRVSGIINDSTLSAARADKTKVQVSIQYVDGLGRPVQTVQQQASPLGYDMIAPQAYDAYGREITKYLPFAPQTGTAGSFRPNAVSTDQHAFYTTPPSGSNVTAITDPIAQTAFDNSPLNRPVEQGAPGVAWQLTGVPGGGHTVKMVYTLNNSISFAGDSINGRQVAMYYTTINSDNSQTLTANGYYPANTLTVTISKDENWASGRAGTVEEYKDIDGHVVLKRVYNYTGTVQVLSTYYVYDDLGRLAFVLPPGLNADTPTTYTLTQLNGLAYMYQYDLRGRPVEKLVPGKGWQYTVYNNMDQPVATQDGNQRANKQWVFTKYDALQRPVMSIIWNNGGTAISRAALQGVISGFTTNLYESSTTTGNGYTNVVWPTTNITATLGLNYYDNYTNIPGLPAAYAAPAGANMATRGEATGNLTAVLNTPANMLWKISYYDYWGRSLKSYVQHYLGGTLNNSNYDAISSTYNFTNAPTTTTRQHFNAASTSYPLVTIFNKYIYDNVGRKLKTWEQLTNTNLAADTLRLVSQIKYNEIGQVYEKQLHSKDSTSFLQNINYGYNERGWLLSSSAPLFAMQLYYNTGTNKQYNGNIAYQYWGVPGNLNNNYTYTYDKLNRLISGASADHNIERGITYDPMGNITHLSRLGSSTLTDSLTYTYTTGTNQIANINDKSGNNNGLVNGTTSYSWEPAGNGNLLNSTNTVNTSQNKSFTYNLLNLPLVATFAAGTATYTYDATGNKLRKVDLKSGVTTTTDYISGIEYDNSTTTIGFIQTEEGKAVPTTTGGYDYNYYISDNLGNTRITFGTKTGAAVLYQQDDYYPFGLEISRSVLFPKNEYLYNKKELQEETGLYDYEHRYYDPLLGRFTTIDRLAEDPEQIDLSPYAYVGNNPIDKTDPHGDCPPCDGPSPAVGILVGGLAIGGTMVAVAAPTVVGEVVAAPAAVIEVAGAAIIAGGVAIYGIFAHHSNSSSVHSSTGSEDNPHSTSKAARKDAMRKEGIPTSQQPTAQKKSAAGNTLTYDVPKKGGGTEQKQVQDQKKDENHGPHWEAGKPKANGQTDPSGRPRMQNDKSKSHYNE